MISFIRKNISSTVYKSLLWITIISVAGLSSLTGLFKRFSGMGSNIVARVDGYDITMLEYRRKTAEEEQRLRYIRQQFGDYAPMILQSLGLSQRPEEQALKTLIQEALINHCGDLLSLHVSPEYITKKLYDPVFMAQTLNDLMPPYLFDQLGGIRHEALIKHLQRQGLTLDYFEDALERALIRSMVISISLGALYIPQAAYKELYLKEQGAKQFSLIAVPFDRYLKKEHNEKINLEELTAYFDQQNKQFDRYSIPEKRSATVWKFIPEKYGIKISDGEIKSYYDSHKDSFISTPEEVSIRRIIVKDEATAQKIIQELVKNSHAFVQLASQYSLDKKALVEKVRRGGKHDQQIEEAAFTLESNGSFSPIIQTAQGFEIIGRVSKDLPIYTPLDKVREKILTAVRLEKFNKTFNVETSQHLAQSLEHPAALTDFIKIKNAENVSIVNKQHDGTLLAKKMFDLPIGKKISVIDNGVGYIVEVSAVQQRYIPSLNSIKDRVVQDLYHERAREKMSADLAQGRKALMGSDIVAVAKNLQGSVEVLEFLPAHKHELEKRNLPLERMVNMINVGATIDHVTSEYGYLIQLKNINYNMAVFPEFIAQKRRALFNDYAGIILESLVASLYKNGTININQSIVASNPYN
ncbi:MAG: SurA N-terminal domain-containing protein [Candidatus Babeliaceae bacterium]|jgi:hypothetical protein